MSYTNKALALVAAGCVSAAVAGGPAAGAEQGSIISFNGPADEAYIGRFIKGIKETAALKGFDIKVFENQFNQAEQDQQVQQVLAAGQLPDVFIWWPSDATAGLGSLRASPESGCPCLRSISFQTSRTSSTFSGTLDPTIACAPGTQAT